MKIWQCKIGEMDNRSGGYSDNLMRDAVADAYRQATASEPKFLFSGWGAALTEPERAVVENRLPKQPTRRQLWRRVMKLAGVFIFSAGPYCRPHYLEGSSSLESIELLIRRERGRLSRGSGDKKSAAILAKLEAALKAWEECPK